MRKLRWIALTLLCLSAPATAAHQLLKISRVTSTDQRLNVQIENARLSAVVHGLQLHLTRPVMLETGGDLRVSFRGTRVSADDVLFGIVRKERLAMEMRAGWWVIRDPQEPTVRLDVKDAEIGAILRTMKEQCGIRNVMIDPEIKQHRGTFLFTDVPCTLAFKVVFSSLGLSAQIEPNSVLNVEKPQ